MNEPPTSTRSSFRRELAHRSNGGLDVTLLWAPAQGEQGKDELVVCVCDMRDGLYFEIPAEPYLAFHIFHHPFAYRDFSTVDYQDHRLAA